MGLAIYDEKVPAVQTVTIAAADGGGQKTVWDRAGALSRIDSLLLTNNDAIDHDVRVTLIAPGVATYLGVVTVPAGQGASSGPPIDAVVALAPTNLGGWTFPSNWTLDVQVTVVMVGGSVIFASAFGGLL